MKTIPDKWFDRYLPFYAKVKELIPKDANVFIAGANDGITYDPIYRIWNPNWHGFYAEPNPTAMENLKKNITSNATFIPYAIGHDETILLYVMSKEAAKAYEQTARIDGSSISSTDYNHVANGLKKHVPDLVKRNKGMKGLILPIYIPCKSFSTLIAEYQIDRLDLVQIDVEEMDDIVVKSLLDGMYLLKITPSIILYEHQRMPQNRQENICRQLHNFGYKTVQLRNDTMGYRL